MTQTPDGEPVWLDVNLAIAIHDRQLSEHGGLSGLRDPSALALAMDRPLNQWAYGERDAIRLAAAYAFGIARNHPLADGNKRTVWVLARLFLVLNEITIQFDAEEAVRIVLDLAEGTLSEEDLAAWFREHLA